MHLKRSKRFGTKWWPSRSNPNNIITRRGGRHPLFIDFFSRVNPKSFPVINPNNVCPRLTYPGKDLSVPLAWYMPLSCLLPSACIPNSLFIKHSCHNINTTLQIINSINKHCRQPALIATPRYLLARITYHHPSILMRLIIQPIGPHLINPAHFINPCHINRINQIFFTTTIKDRIKKRYIRSMMKNLTRI